jgi:hypothetical protein
MDAESEVLEMLEPTHLMSLDADVLVGKLHKLVGLPVGVVACSLAGSVQG